MRRLYHLNDVITIAVTENVSGGWDLDLAGGDKMQGDTNAICAEIAGRYKWLSLAYSEEYRPCVQGAQRHITTSDRTRFRRLSLGLRWRSCGMLVPDGDCRLALDNVARSRARLVGRLLHHVGQLMREKSPSVQGLRCKLSASKNNIAPRGKRKRTDFLCSTISGFPPEKADSINLA